MTAIDLFAGAGGFSTGARKAGCKVVWAANHNPVAVQWHKANHPHTTHLCQDLHQADWTQVPKHNVQLASPSCKGHTRGRGKEQPHHDAERATAWAVVACAEVHRPDYLVVENVPEFLSWELFPSWCDALQRLGYTLSPQVLDAADFGVPQHRVRAFVIGTKSKAPVAILPRRRDYVPASSVIDWSVKPERDWRQLCPNTRRRIRNGRREHGDRFLIPYYGNSTTGRSLERPIGTITCVDRYALIDGYHMRMLTWREYMRFMAFPDNYKLPDDQRIATDLLGNAVPPPMATAVINAL